MKVAFILYPQVLATGISVPVEMFNAASLLADADADFSSVCVSETAGPVKLTGGVKLVADYDYENAPSVDWIFLPPMWGSPWAVLNKASKLLIWLKACYQNGARIVATGTGVGLLAMTGLLDGKVATTHWYYLKRFERRFKDVNFQEKHFITHQDGLYCAGSINAQTDLVLHFIQRFFGERALALVEQQFMHELKRNTPTPFYEPGGAVHDDESVSQVQAWIRMHLSEEITINQLASLIGRSTRQLHRRFVAATGAGAAEYIKRVRIEEAQALLRESNLSIADIGLATGHQSSAYFTQMFKRVSGLTPSAYRKMVRKKTFSAS